MSYCFERNESIASAVPRIVTELTSIATHALHSDHPDFEAWVHSTRTCYKKIRSLLRLIRRDLNKSVYRDEQIRIRNAGNALSRLRDAEVMVLSYDLLAGRYRDKIAMDGLIETREALIARHQRIAQNDFNLQQLLRETANELSELPLRCSDWSPMPTELTSLVAGFERSYRRGCRAFEQATREPSSDGFHEWRKRVKDHWYQCRLFDSAWTPSMRWRIYELKGLADLLGEDHDLAVLQQVLTAEAGEIGGDTKQLGDLARQFQQELRDRATELGRKIYTTEPPVLASRLTTSLERWR